MGYALDLRRLGGLELQNLVEWGGRGRIALWISASEEENGWLRCRSTKISEALTRLELASYNIELFVHSGSSFYLDSIIVIVVIFIAVESEINHLLRMRQKFSEKGEALVIAKVGRAT